MRRRPGDEQFTTEQSKPEFGEIEGDVIARTHEIARWRESGDVAYQRDFAMRLTLDDSRVVRIVVMPGGAPLSQVDPGSPATNRLRHPRRSSHPSGLSMQSPDRQGVLCALQGPPPAGVR